jgi:hypothetical protein
MSDAGFRSMHGYREQIADSLTPVRPLPPPARRAGLLAPLGLLLAASAPLLGGQRGDLGDYHPLVTWGLTALQSFGGLWLLALGFREAVPGRNVSPRALTFAAALSAVLVVAITSVTNAASPTIVPVGRELQYWVECVAGPMAIGAPFMIVATLMALRAFPTRPAIAGALCGASAGILADAGWRLACWISAPSHIIGSHVLAILALAAAGSLVALAADRPRWRRLRRSPP